jgi:hypothetical protein
VDIPTLIESSPLDRDRENARSIQQREGYSSCSLATAMYPPEKSSVIQAQAVQAPVDRISTPSPQPDGSLVLVPLCFIAIWVGLIYVIADTWKFNRKETKISRELAQLPCKKCQFFSNNHYLKCAVNPSVVMTHAANECQDYRSKKSSR